MSSRQKQLTGVSMNTKFRAIVFGSLIAGSLMLSAAPVMAHDWYRRGHDYSWSRRADLRRDYSDLAEARRRLNYDAAHHASRRRLAYDRARIQDILADIRSDRRGWWYRG